MNSAKCLNYRIYKSNFCFEQFAMPVSVNKSHVFISSLSFKTFRLLHIFIGKNIPLTLLKKNMKYYYKLCQNKLTGRN
jgi:hypothetical protein